MNEPIDIRTKQPLNRKEPNGVDGRTQEVLTAQEVAAQQQTLAASRLDAQFTETSQWIRLTFLASSPKPWRPRSALSRRRMPSC
jgi:hypothetical protein